MSDQKTLDLPKIAEKFESLSYSTKLAFIRDYLERFHLRFPELVPSSIFKELERIASHSEDDFILQRSANHLIMLTSSIAWFRKKLSREIALFPAKGHYGIRLIPSSLHFTFGSKPVLGILAHAYLKDKYGAFHEEHILLKIRKWIQEAHLVKDSVYVFHSPKNDLKTLYFEIDKKNGASFHSEEIKKLKNLLKEEIEFCVEELVPRMFMTRNEEEILKNVLTLSREIRHVSDLPQVMILLDRQTSREAIFTVILVRVCKQKASISELFSEVEGYFQERCQVVRYLRKKYPIEANVFRIHLSKDPSLFRTDLSINFYLARQRISDLLFNAVGEFRDFNGGIILKQREALTTFMEAFPELSHHDLLENFFYSLDPIEAQAILPLSSLTTLFNLFQEALRYNLTKESDYFLKFDQKGHRLFLMIRISDGEFKEKLKPLFSSLENQVVTSTLNYQDTFFLGYFITDPPQELQERITTILAEWKQKLESLRVLKLVLEHSVVSLDPRIGGDGVSSLIIKMLSEGLMRENRSGKIEYGVAKSVEISSDLKTYRFLLRPTYWSDGSLVTAFDFEYAWKKVLSPSFKTPFSYLFYPIKNAQAAKCGDAPSDTIGIQVVDEMTLKVELDLPIPYFLELTAHTIYSPIHRLLDQLHPNWPFQEGNAYICNGSFQLIENNPNEGYKLVKNPLYWDAANILLDQISILKVNHYEAFEMYKKNTIHWVGVPMVAADPYFILSEKEDERVDFLCKNMYWYNFNCAKPPFDNKKIRQAFSLAIDRVQLASLFNTQPAFSLLTKGHSLAQHSPLSCFNPHIAKILLDEALEEMSMSKKNFPVITLIFLKGSIRDRLAKMIQTFWKTIFNIRCNVESLTWNVLFRKMTEGDYQIGCMVWDSWMNDPLYTLNAFRDAKEPVNFSKWENKKYQQILYQAERELDFQKRQEYYFQAEEFLIDEMPATPIFLNPWEGFKKKNIKIKPVSSLINFKWAYFDS